MPQSVKLILIGLTVFNVGLAGFALVSFPPEVALAFLPTVLITPVAVALWLIAKSVNPIHTPGGLSSKDLDEIRTGVLDAAKRALRDCGAQEEHLEKLDKEIQATRDRIRYGEFGKRKPFRL